MSKLTIGTPLYVLYLLLHRFRLACLIGNRAEATAIWNSSDELRAVAASVTRQRRRYASGGYWDIDFETIYRGVKF